MNNIENLQIELNALQLETTHKLKEIEEKYFLSNAIKVLGSCKNSKFAINFSVDLSLIKSQD